MADDHSLWKPEDIITTELFKELLVPKHVAGIGVQQQVADIDEPIRTQNALQFGEQTSLFAFHRHTSEHSKQEHPVKRT